MKAYTLDPRNISLEKFFQMTRGRKMLPSRVELRNQMDRRFETIRREKIANLGELLSALGSKSKLEAFSQKTGIPVDYLVLLKREAGSYLARPFPLSHFPGIPFEYTEILKSKGKKNTRDFFEGVRTKKQRLETVRETGIPEARLQELFALCDLSRITGVGGVFARVVYEAGIRSSKEFANTKAHEHYGKYMAVIEKFGYSAGHFSVDDIAYCIEYARVVDEADHPEKAGR